MSRAGIAAALLFGLIACLALPPAPDAQSGGNPLAGIRLFVDHDSPSWHQWRAYRRSGQRRKAALIRKIAREPKAVWLGRFTRPHFRKKVRRLVVAAKRQRAVPLFTVMRAVSDRCGPTYTAGGPAEDARTRAWYRRLARPPDHGLVQPGPARSRHAADDEHVEPDGGRVPVDQPARLCAALSGSADRLVRAARAGVRAPRDALGVPAAGYPVRVPQAIPVQRL